MLWCSISVVDDEPKDESQRQPKDDDNVSEKHENEGAGADGEIVNKISLGETDDVSR